MNRKRTPYIRVAIEVIVQSDSKEILRRIRESAAAATSTIEEDMAGVSVTGSNMECKTFSVTEILDDKA